MTRWEYLEVDLWADNSDSNEKNKLGDQGWEAYAATPKGQYTTHYFKRPTAERALADLGKLPRLRKSTAVNDMRRVKQGPIVG